MAKLKTKYRIGTKRGSLREAFNKARRLFAQTPAKDSHTFGYPSFTPAARALAYARDELKREPIDWGNGRETAEETIDGFRVVYSVTEDSDPDISYLGKFVNRWESGAIDRFRADAGAQCSRFPDRYGNDVEARASELARHSREMRYFVPSGCRGTVAETRTWYRAHGYPRHVAHVLALQQAAEDVKRAESYGDAWSCVVVTARAFKRGIELGSSSCGGIETDSVSSYRDEIARDQAADAVRQAKEALAELRA